MRDTVLDHLHLLNFKNHPELEVDFSPGLNAFVGKNGAGKTNVLDAIYYLCTTKSYFHTTDADHVRHGETFFAIRGLFRSDDGPIKVHCAVQPSQKKSFRVDDSEYARLSDHIGRFPVVVISPSDRDLLSEGSALRRKFLDGMVAQGDRVYLDRLLQYQRVVQQRNALLKYFAANRVFSAEQLALYDDQLCALAPYLYAARLAFTSAFAPELQRFYSLLSGGQEAVDWTYESDLNNAPLDQLLRDSLARDRVVQYTTTGLHKDDLVFTLNGHPLKKVGSQGQQKSYLVSVKLAQFAQLTRSLGRKPLLLLDDVFDKLDAERVEALVSLVKAQEFGQIFLSDTHADRTNALVKRMDPDGRVVVLEL